MLYLTRRQGESVIINDAIKVTFVEQKGRNMKLKFEFPEGTAVYREELYERILNENKKAAESSLLFNQDLLLNKDSL